VEVGWVGPGQLAGLHSKGSSFMAFESQAQTLSALDAP
jgi:hypothetical protein